MVALGDADAQRVSLGHDRGTISVHDDTGWMRITHANYSDSGETEMIFNETLGSVVYESEEGTIAYQGGGVWKTQQGGQAQMISPPEFHYRGATLTLPAIQVTGDGAASGSVDLTVTPRQQARVVYPNATTATEDGTGAPYDETATTSYRNYTNPVRSGTVNVTVHSEYADGWETYFRERTTGNTTREGDTVTLTLATTSGPPGAFEMPVFGTEDYVEASGIGDDHPLTDFETSVVFDEGGGTNEFSYWYEDEDSGTQWELHVSPKNSGNFDASDEPDVYIAQYFYDGNSVEEYEVWETTVSASSDAIEWSEKDNGDPELTIDFMAADTETEMEYDDSGVKTGGGKSGDVCDGNQWCFGENINDKDTEMKNEVTLDGHGTIGGCEPGTYSKGETDTGCMLGHIVNHYLSEAGPDVRLHAKTGPGGSDPIQQGRSGGTLLYEEQPGARFVTYLHVTKNEVDVDLD
nr:hypothetical protein [Halapricum desulfuricans]